MLWIDLNGRIACSDHLGAQATALLTRAPLRRTLRTTLTEWVRVGPDLISAFAERGIQCQCERCKASA